jgi:hypothetical protein
MMIVFVDTSGLFAFLVQDVDFYRAIRHDSPPSRERIGKQKSGDGEGTRPFCSRLALRQNVTPTQKFRKKILMARRRAKLQMIFEIYRFML